MTKELNNFLKIMREEVTGVRGETSVSIDGFEEDLTKDPYLQILDKLIYKSEADKHWLPFSKDQHMLAQSARARDDIAGLKKILNTIEQEEQRRKIGEAQVFKDRMLTLKTHSVHDTRKSIQTLEQQLKNELQVLYAFSNELAELKNALARQKTVVTPFETITQLKKARLQAKEQEIVAALPEISKRVDKTMKALHLVMIRYHKEMADYVEKCTLQSTFTSHDLHRLLQDWDSDIDEMHQSCFFVRCANAVTQAFSAFFSSIKQCISNCMNNSSSKNVQMQAKAVHDLVDAFNLDENDPDLQPISNRIK